jgi:NhaP-type Na+/H+ and K+/H+ antiporter
VLAIAGLLLIISLLASKVSDRFGIPARLLFLLLGMLAGSDRPGGSHSDDPALTQFVGVIALAFILFSGGLDTDWRSIRPVLKRGVGMGASVPSASTAYRASKGSAGRHNLAHEILPNGLLWGIIAGTAFAVDTCVQCGAGLCLH